MISRGREGQSTRVDVLVLGYHGRGEGGHSNRLCFDQGGMKGGYFDIGRAY